MLLYTKRAAPKQPKRRTRTGCIRCKQKKKKCNEERPECQRCVEHGMPCEYEVQKIRKRDRGSFSGSSYSAKTDPYKRQEYPHKQSGEDEVWGGYIGTDAESVDWSFAPTFDYNDAAFVEHIENVVVQSPGALVAHTGSWSGSRYPDLAMIAPSPVASPLLEFSAPAFMEFSDKTNRRGLVDHFCNVMSHLIVFKEDNGNPFRQLVLPLSHSSPAVMDAIYALSSAHLEYRGVKNEEMSLTFHNRALKGIAQLIEDNTGSREELLGAIMLLVYYEVLVQQGNSNIVQGHLKGALAIMNASSEVETPTTVFLERAFRFYDVVTALSLGIAPSTSSQSRPTPLQFASQTSESESQHSSLSNVDVLLGLSTELWPIIHRLSHLLSMKSSLDEAVATGQNSKAFVLRAELENSSHAIEIALTKWVPSTSSPVIELDQLTILDEDLGRPSSIEPIDIDPATKTSEIDPNEDAKDCARIESILCNAEAYRHSALVYLYRIIQCRPCENPQVQKHVRLSLAACSTVVASSEQCSNFNAPMAALLWPLFVAACEATTEEDRNVSQQTFFGCERRQGMRNIMRAWEVVQEVWQRRDCGEAGVDWRDVCTEKGINIVFG